MGEPMMTVMELATASVVCSRCGALPGETCATSMRRSAEASKDEAGVRELRELERAGSLLTHPERLKEAEELVDSAVAYGLVRRAPVGKAG